MNNDKEMIDKLVDMNKNFDKMSLNQRRQWFEGTKEVKVDHFFRANQRVFEELGEREKSTERRDFFLEMLKEKVKTQSLDFDEGHPITNYLKENVVIRELCKQINSCFKSKDLATYSKTLELLKELKNVHIHYLRKEDQLFPYLEKHGFTYPSNGMWKFQDEMRASIKEIIKAFEENRVNDEVATLLKETVKDINDMTTREEKMLLPASVILLTEDEWIKMSEEEKEIGYIFIDNPPIWPKEKTKDTTKKISSLNDSILIQDGALSKEQLELFFSHLPFDVTVVDENDRVAFFNKGAERTFLRSPGVIGREVRYCHPPKSVDTVLKILEAFKDGSKDSAEFWINFKERLVHIRYFALRDKERKYKGVVEITQDITDIQKIEGERRILDWK